MLDFLCCCCPKKKQQPKIQFEDTELGISLLTEHRDINTIEDVKIKNSTFVQKRTLDIKDIYNFDNKQELGEGGYGKVYLVNHIITGEKRALKQIKKTDLAVDVKNMIYEIEILKNLDHPNILKIYEFFEDDEYIYLVTEYCDQGDLFGKLEKLPEGKFDEVIVTLVMYEILIGVAYLHSRNVFHGDLKLENILLLNSDSSNSRNSFNHSCNLDMQGYNDRVKLRKRLTYTNLFLEFRNFSIKIIDFGCSKIFTRSNKKFTGITGSMYYIAPEVIDNIYDYKADMWSCGIILYSLLSGEAPFVGITEEDTLLMIKQGKFKFSSVFDNISDCAKDLIKRMLTKDPNQRISAKEALSHEFFKSQIDTRKIYYSSDLEWLKDVKNTKSNIKFYQAVIAYMTHNFGVNEDTIKMSNLFKSLDINFDGKLSREELYDGFKNHNQGITEEEISKIVDVIDDDGNGFIEYEEFMRRLIRKDKLFTEKNLKAAFDFFDQNQSGSINFEEMKSVIFSDKDIPDAVLDEFLAQINKKRDEDIDYQEFKNIMVNLHTE